MQKEIPKKNQDVANQDVNTEDVKFGYSATIVFLIFIGFIIYISVTK
ncbi:MAG: hypothetical protein Q9M36_12240 [Sulfurovum sp.]|nr:hypothetical protein [Sulfurovum sp.]